MDHIAFIKWSEKENRFELYIDRGLKAYSLEPHEVGKKEMINLAKKNGYTVKED